MIPLRLFLRAPYVCVRRVPQLYNVCKTTLDVRVFSLKAQDAEIPVTFKAKTAESSSVKVSLEYKELKDLLEKSSVQLFDVRSAADVHSTGTIPGAMNIPLVELKKALKMDEEAFLSKYGVKKPKQVDDNIIFYGLSDVSSASACEIAHGLGFKKARYYLNGWTEWSKLNDRV